MSGQYPGLDSYCDMFSWNAFLDPYNSKIIIQTMWPIIGKKNSFIHWSYTIFHRFQILCSQGMGLHIYQPTKNLQFRYSCFHSEYILYVVNTHAEYFLLVLLPEAIMEIVLTYEMLQVKRLREKGLKLPEVEIMTK